MTRFFTKSLGRQRCRRWDSVVSSTREDEREGRVPGGGEEREAHGERGGESIRKRETERRGTEENEEMKYSEKDVSRSRSLK